MDPILNPASTSVAATVLVPYLLQFVKRFLPGMTADAANLVMRALQMVAAVLTSVGVRWSFDASAGTLLVEGLTLGALMGFALQVAAQYKSFEVIYRAAIKPPKATA
jgi:hypothetical protein